ALSFLLDPRPCRRAPGATRQPPSAAGADQSTIHHRWQPLAAGRGRDRRSPVDRAAGNTVYIAAGDPKGAPFPRPRAVLAKALAVLQQTDGSARPRTWQRLRGSFDLDPWSAGGSTPLWIFG